ncbi:hypothetical protein ACJX0J_023760, partial [Zea mays]
MTQAILIEKRYRDRKKSLVPTLRDGCTKNWVAYSDMVLCYHGGFYNHFGHWVNKIGLSLYHRKLEINAILFILASLYPLSACLIFELNHGFQIDETGVYKNLLQEVAQRVGAPLPLYTTERSGLGHLPVFTCTVELAGITFAGDPAKNKKQAEKNAASAAWSALKQ